MKNPKELVYIDKDGFLWLVTPGLAYTECPDTGAPFKMEVGSSDPHAVFRLMESYGLKLLGEL